MSGLVERDERAGAMYQHILIPTDGSELAHKAVVHGLSLAKAVGAKITALTVEPSFNVYDVPASKVNLMSAAFDEYAKHARAHSASILDRIADNAKAAGVQCETIQVIQDHPYKAIVATAEEKGCDLIVMASHGRSGIAALVLGSVTARVLTQTILPVLVCH
jgi:nucleotide-binding universal stress UspA family protein